MRPTAELLDEYEAYLTDKRSTTMYVVNTMSRCRLLLAATKTKTIADLDTSRITTTLAAWRSREEDPISVTTSNHYARAVKSFAGWLQRSKITPDHPLIGLRLLNAKYDRKRNRRSLSASELNELITKTERSDETLYGQLIAKHGHLTGASLHAAHKLLENAYARYVKAYKLMWPN